MARRARGSRRTGVSSADQLHGESHARDELRDWARARVYRDLENKNLELARRASDRGVQKRYLTIAQHYRTLAEAAEQSAYQKGAERRSRRRR